jgi:hypothetical protein
LLLEVQDLSKVIECTLDKLKQHCQMVMTNALSHERMTPLNQILTLSSQIIEHGGLDNTHLLDQV